MYPNAPLPPDSGLFIELVDGVDGFVHISELTEEFVASMDEIDLGACDAL